MTALELIARLRDKGIRITARDGELELDAPAGALDEELRAELLRRKPDLLRLLSWTHDPARTCHWRRRSAAEICRCPGRSNGCGFLINSSRVLPHTTSPGLFV